MSKTENYITQRITINRFLDQIYSFDPHHLSEASGLIIHPETVREFYKHFSNVDFDGDKFTLNGYRGFSTDLIEPGYVGLVFFPTNEAVPHEYRS